MTATTEPPPLVEHHARLGSAEAVLRSPLGKIFRGGFLANCKHREDDEHDLGRVEGCGEATKLDATSRAKLGEVNHGVLANVKIQSSVLLCIFNFLVEVVNLMKRTPSATIPALGILTEQNRGEAIAETHQLFAPIEDLSGRGGATGRASMDGNMDTALSLTHRADRTLGSDGFQEREKFKNVLKASIALENWRNKLALHIVVEGVNRRVAICFPHFTIELGSGDRGAIHHGSTDIESVAMGADGHLHIGGNLGFDFDTEGCLVVYHGKHYALSQPAWQDISHLFFGLLCLCK